MKKEGIIVKKDNFFNKLITFIKTRFYNNKQKNNLEMNKKVKEDELKNNNKIKIDDEKNRVFKMYNALKNKKITIYDIPSEDLQIIKKLMLQEIDLKEKKLMQIQTDINIFKNNIEHYSEELKKLKTRK